MSCYTESEIAAVVLEIIREHDGIRTSGLIEEAERRMKPSGEDLEILDNRNDTRFSQKVRNIKSHDTLKDLVWTEGERDRRWHLK